jgi:restriction system protein
MWLHLDEKVYRRLRDVVIPTSNGTTQIDHVVLSVYGIFVVETKNFQGWIFGNPKESNWCQSLPGGKKSRFQNPLHQNFRHIQCLAEFLKLDPKVFHSVVHFIGECKLKTPMPPNVMTSGMSTYIKSFTTDLFGRLELMEIERELTDAKLKSGLTKQDHLASLEQRHRSTTTCPKCGGQLVQRTAKASGKTFLSCSNFPKCRHTFGS